MKEFPPQFMILRSSDNDTQIEANARMTAESSLQMSSFSRQVSSVADVSTPENDITRRKIVFST